MPPPPISPTPSEEPRPPPAGPAPQSATHRDRGHPLRPVPRLFDPANLNKNAIHPFAGATAGLVSGICVCPLDVIKTKLQAQGGWSRNGAATALERTALPYRGLFGTARVILQEEGIRGMYRGLGPLVLGYLPTWTVYFTVYEKTKAALESEIRTPWKVHILSSVTAGASSTICTNPIWVIKTRFMSQAASAKHSNIPYHYTSTLDAARKMYLQEGIRAFYAGLAPALLGLSHVIVQFPLYEHFKRLFTGGVELGKQGEGGQMNYMGILAASLLSKICASSATYPHEVLRTRLQTQVIMNGRGREGMQEEGRTGYRNIVHCFKTIVREEGWRALYSGMGTNMARAVPAAAVTLLTYEVVVGTLTKWKEDSIAAHDARDL